MSPIVKRNSIHLAKFTQRLQHVLFHSYFKVCQEAGQLLLHETAHLQHPPATHGLSLFKCILDDVRVNSRASAVCLSSHLVQNWKPPSQEPSHMTFGSDGGSPDGRVGVKVFEAFRHADW